MKRRYPEVPWREIAGFRNVVVHDYLGVSVERVWDVVEQRLPELKPIVARMLADLGTQSP